MSKGLNITQPLWTPIYHDAFAYGLQISVVMPAYIKNESTNTKILIGVIGIDIPLFVFEELTGLQIEKIQSEFKNQQNYYLF